LGRGARDHDCYARELVPGAGLLKAMMNRLVCADGGNPDPRSTSWQATRRQCHSANAVAPGPVSPPIQPSGGQPPDNLPDFDAEIPMGRPGQPAEFAMTVSPHHKRTRPPTEASKKQQRASALHSAEALVRNPEWVSPEGYGDLVIKKIKSRPSEAAYSAFPIANALARATTAGSRLAACRRASRAKH
jgi:hypothetical protein